MACKRSRVQLPLAPPGFVLQVRFQWNFAWLRPEVVQAKFDLWSRKRSLLSGEAYTGVLFLKGEAGYVSRILRNFMFRSIMLLKKKLSRKSRWIAFFCLFSLVCYSFAGILYDDFGDSDDCLIGKAVHIPWLHESEAVFNVIFYLLSSFACCFLLIIPADCFVSIRPSRAPPQLIF